MDLDYVIRGLREEGSVRQRAIDEQVQYFAGDETDAYKAQYHDLLLDFIKHVPESDEYAVYSAVAKAGALVDGFAQACYVESYLTEPLPKAPEVWRHRDVAASIRNGYTSSEFSHGNLEELVGVAKSYLDSGFQSSLFEVLIVDAIVATEITSFAEELKRHPSRFLQRISLPSLWLASGETGRYIESKGNSEKLAWLTLRDRSKIALGVLFFVYVLPLFLAWFAAEHNYSELAATIVVVVATIFLWRCALWLWRTVRNAFSRELAKTSALIGKMTQAYDELSAGEAASPQRVRELLVRAADDGAVWPPVVFSILDRAIQRGRGSWSIA